MVLFDEENANMHAAGCVVFPLCAALAMSAGIGGGGLFVPLLMLILGKSVAEATSMSQCLIAGAAIAGIVYNSQQSHPTRKRPLILLDAVVFFAPLQMSGALMGNVLNQMMPKYLIVMTLVVVLILSATKSYLKGLQLYRNEGKASNRSQKLEDVESSPNKIHHQRTASKSPAHATVVEMGHVPQTGTPKKAPNSPLAGAMSHTTSMRHRNVGSPSLTSPNRPSQEGGMSSHTYAAVRPFQAQSPNPKQLEAHQSLIKGDSLRLKKVGSSMKDIMSSLYEGSDASNRYKVLTDDEGGNPDNLELEPENLAENEEPEKEAEGLDRKKAGLLFLVWLATLVLIFARGGKGADSVFGLTYCGAGYWSASAIAVLGLMAFAAKVGRDLVRDTEAKHASGYLWAEGDLIWTNKKCCQMAAATVFAGIMAGLVGIGGGMVLGPVLLEAGYIPQVSSALTATNVLLSSTTVGVLVLVSGVVPIDESMFFFGICLLGAFLGKFYLGKVIKRIGRTSVIIFTLVGVICLSIVAVLAKSIPVWASEGFVGKFTAVCGDV